LILFYWVMNLFSFGYEHQGLAMAPHNIANWRPDEPDFELRA
jgi:hypothetical protein